MFRNSFSRLLFPPWYARHSKACIASGLIDERAASQMCFEKPSRRDEKSLVMSSNRMFEPVGVMIICPGVKRCFCPLMVKSASPLRQKNMDVCCIWYTCCTNCCNDDCVVANPCNGIFFKYMLFIIFFALCAFCLFVTNVVKIYNRAKQKCTKCVLRRISCNSAVLYFYNNVYIKNNRYPINGYLLRVI